VRRFLGTYYHTIDAKGRLSIPSVFRRAAGQTLMLSRWHEGCLCLWPMEEWERYAEKLLALHQESSDPRYYMRALALYAAEVKVDTHGRIMIPEYLREFAALERDVVVGGVFNHIEIWNPDRLAKYLDGGKRSFEESSERLYETRGVESSADGPERKPKRKSRGRG